MNFASRHKVHSTNTLSAQRRLIKPAQQNVLQWHWRLNHRVTNTFLTEYLQRHRRQNHRVQLWNFNNYNTNCLKPAIS